MSKEKLGRAGPADEDAAAESMFSDGRRKAIKAGLAGVPLILTLRSAPAWDDEPAPKVSPVSPTHTGKTASRMDPQPTDDQGIDG